MRREDRGNVGEYRARKVEERSSILEEMEGESSELRLEEGGGRF
jgi:hypothetical protein